METAKRARRRDDCDAPPDFSSLPPEMIGEILLRLPAKSIARFRSVSKLFRSLSSDRAFAKTHLDLSLRSDAFPSGRTRLIVSRHNLYTVDFDSICYGCDGIRDLDAVEIHYPLKDQPNLLYMEDEDEYPDMVDPAYKRNPVPIFGSCNGLVCISPDEGALFLFNPTTGESKRIPDLPESLGLGSRGAFGFWFDSIADDYKVVKLVRGDDVLNAIVYSLKTDSWKWVGDLRYNVGFRSCSSGVLVNGVLHWIARLREDNDRQFVVAFDTMSEQFKDMPLPDEAEDCPNCDDGDLVVGELNGRLCIGNNCFDLHDDIWVMNEYGVASSWSGIRVREDHGYMGLLCSTRNEEHALAELDGELVLCNLGNGTSRPVVLKGLQMYEDFEVHVYVESLVSPNSYGRA
ncbi:PREDICTED: F-box/kelch-repeat protein At3g06240-like [Tarenaya hassleriana]|uniref:F-box/kelch-repeat protein At3g06240-like n=1 Tax=Tarenaya hassleriana TaxID=28532 RepID=UPI0008FD1466|nr:PREDICTED: F-box/kelch-repeat protein At3g06240-like [Tarenaya hassleriana]